MPAGAAPRHTPAGRAALVAASGAAALSASRAAPTGSNRTFAAATDLRTALRPCAAPAATDASATSSRPASAGPAALAAAAAAATSVAVPAARRRAARCPRSDRCRTSRRAETEAASEADEERTRPVRIEFEGTVETDVIEGDVASMDAFMRENAETVCIQNVSRIEPKPGGDPSVKYCYLEATDVGPFRTEMRLTLQVVMEDTKRVNILIPEMWPGSVDKKTGEVTYDPANVPEFETTNFLTWEDNGSGGLRVVNTSRNVSITTLPWWFPVPDFLVKKLTQFFISKVVSTGMKEVNKQIEKQYSEWVSTKVPEMAR